MRWPFPPRMRLWRTPPIFFPSQHWVFKRKNRLKTFWKHGAVSWGGWGGWKYHKANKSKPHQNTHFSRIAGKWILWKRQLEMDQVSSTLKRDFWASIVARNDIQHFNTKAIRKIKKKRTWQMSNLQKWMNDKKKINIQGVIPPTHWDQSHLLPHKSEDPAQVQEIFHFLKQYKRKIGSDFWTLILGGLKSLLSLVVSALQRFCEQQFPRTPVFKDKHSLNMIKMKVNKDEYNFCRTTGRKMVFWRKLKTIHADKTNKQNTGNTASFLSYVPQTCISQVVYEKWTFPGNEEPDAALLAVISSLPSIMKKEEEIKKYCA